MNDAPIEPPVKLPWTARLIAALIAVGAAAVLIMLFRLTPAAEGLGTHTQLGLNTCSWRVGKGYDCPTCGFTTAAALATHGRLITSFLTHPAGMLSTLATAAAALLAGYSALTGSFGPTLFIWPLLRWRTAFIIAALFAASWAYRLSLR